MNQVVPWPRFPSGEGRTFAWLPFPAEELAARYGLRFERGQDDLDRYQFAAVGDPDAGQLWLWEYERVPGGGTEVIGDDRLHLGRVFCALRRQFPGIAGHIDSARAALGKAVPPVVPIVLHGPGGVGKDHVLDQLKVARLVSTTDRAPRSGEVDGRDYYFVHSDVFETLVEAGAFAEWAPVLGYSKGITRHVVNDALRSGLDFVIRTDIQGAVAWRKQLPGAVTVRLLGLDPALPFQAHREDLVQRLRVREASDDEIEKRLVELEDEYATDLDHYTVVNTWGRPEDAVSELLAIAERERHNPNRPAPRLLA